MTIGDQTGSSANVLLYANSYQRMLFCDTNEQDIMPIICTIFPGS